MREYDPGDTHKRPGWGAGMPADWVRRLGWASNHPNSEKVVI